MLTARDSGSRVGHMPSYVTKWSCCNSIERRSPSKVITRQYRGMDADMSSAEFWGIWEIKSSRKPSTATGTLSRPPTTGWRHEQDESLTQLAGADDRGRAPGAQPLDLVCVDIGRTQDSTGVAFRGKFTFKCHLTRSVGMPVDVQAVTFFILSIDVKLLPAWYTGPQRPEHRS